MKTQQVFHAQIISNLLVILLASSSSSSLHLEAASCSDGSQSNHTQAAAAAAATTSTYDTQHIHSATTTQKASQLNGSGHSTGRNLIGSILLRAASLNSLNAEDRQQQLLFGADANGSESEYDSDFSIESRNQAASQLSVPTDSGEDPLESTTIPASSVQQQDDAAHRISQQQAPPKNNTTTTAAVVLSESELAVNSNNVSAVLSAVYPLASSPLPTSKVGSPMSCEQAYTQCALRKACAPALKAYNDHCHELISNQTEECSPKCLDAMISLRSSEEGDDLANCDCGAQEGPAKEYCLASKQRSLLCKQQVDHAVDPRTVVSCSTASWICMADQSCAPALGFYYRNCRSLLTQRHCSARCNNSLTVLHRQPKAAKLITCQCDGSEDFPCLKLKTFTGRLCLNQPPLSPTTMMDGDGDGAFGVEEPPTEEESSNLTNNPENFLMGVPMASTEAGAGDDDGDDDDNNNDRANNKQDAAIEESSYNGIQLVEDNWIPLISGRYFTNLHHQQQQQHHAPGAAAAAFAVKQRNKPKEIIGQHTRQQQQQQTKRIQRNMRQHRARSTTTVNATHQHEGGGKRSSRFGRIFMFAASTSPSSAATNHRCFNSAHYWISSLMAGVSAIAVVHARTRSQQVAVNV